MIFFKELSNWILFVLLNGMYEVKGVKYFY